MGGAGGLRVSRVNKSFLNIFYNFVPFSFKGTKMLKIAHAFSPNETVINDEHFYTIC